MASHPDLIQAFAGDETKGATHYIQWGYKEKRQTTFSDLDALQYVASFADLIQSIGSDVITAIRHYVTTGYNAGRRITLDALAYIASYGDLIAAFGTNAISGAQHYINWGYKEGRKVTFDALGYLAKYADLRAAFGNNALEATKHYITWGYKEGRAPPASPTATLSTSNASPYQGDSITLTWSSTNTTSCTAGGAWSGTLAVSGSQAVVVAALCSNQYTLSCSGAGGSASASVSTTSTSKPLMSPTALLLPDFYAKSMPYCQNDISRVQWRMRTANLRNHKDGRKDFIVAVSCMTFPSGSVNNGPVPGGIFVFVQKSDGTFYDATSALFGVDLIKLDGMLLGPMANADVNGDGYDEVVISVSGEDGRTLPTPPRTDYYKKTFALISNRDGTYKTASIGNPTMGDGIQVVTNGSSKNFLLAANYGGPEEAFQYNAGSFQLIDYYKNPSSSLILAQPNNFGFFNIPMSSSFMSIGDASAAVNSAIVGNYDYSIATYSVNLMSRSSAGVWSSLDSWTLPTFATAQYTGWSGTTGTMGLVKVGTNDVAFIALNVNCQITEPSQASPTTLFMTNAQIVTGGYRGQALKEGSPDFTPAMMFFGFNVSNGKLTSFMPTIKNSLSDQPTWNYMTCTSLRNNGYQDIFVSTAGSSPKPLVYVRQDVSSYASVNQSNFPSAQGAAGFTMLFEDVDGDRIPDLVYYPYTAVAAQSGGGQIYKGLRYIESKDLN